MKDGLAILRRREGDYHVYEIRFPDRESMDDPEVLCVLQREVLEEDGWPKIIYRLLPGQTVLTCTDVHYLSPELIRLWANNKQPHTT